MKLSREEKKLLVEQLLDEFIEQHKRYKETACALCDAIASGTKILAADDYILMYGVVELGEILGCCITFEPILSSTHVSIEYKGFLFVEHLK